jgi:zinc transporter 1
LILLTSRKKKDRKNNQNFCFKISGVSSVHELHIWSLSGRKIIATAHVTCHNTEEYMEIAAKIKKFFHEKGIHSTTIQPEFTNVLIK